MANRRPDMLREDVRWFDDWFAIQEIAPGIHAIGEPRFHQINWNYLVIGQHTALMFDTGPGVRDITPVIASLTSLPVIALPSHMHYDHTGNLHRFEDIAMPDLPLLRACEKDGTFHASDDLFLGFREGMAWKPCKVSRWWPIGSTIDLGGRSPHLIHTPGHSPDSVSLMDQANDIILAADFIYLGALYAQVPGANLRDYETAAAQILAMTTEKTAIFGAHGLADANDQHSAPQLARNDVSDLAQSLRNLKRSGEKPKSWPVNDKMHMVLADHAFAAWQSP
jgi:hydroxyacylglutathione hydrolase